MVLYYLFNPQRNFFLVLIDNSLIHKDNERLSKYLAVLAQSWPLAIELTMLSQEADYVFILPIIN
jgi:hypothetical protein